PGNAGTGEFATNVGIGAGEISALADFAEAEGIDLTVVGPDDTLAAGVVDAFEKRGLAIFGPSASAARLESSKAFAKDFMRRHGIPTADYREFTAAAEARDYCEQAAYPLVIKADGLALGKGVIIAQDRAEAAAAIDRLMEKREFGAAGDRVVVEEFLTGVECSIHALVDGESWLLFPDCRDHKQAFDGGIGPNTGGMGTISPSHSAGPELLRTVRAEVLDRFVAGLKADGLDFRGMLFPGLMITPAGPKVLEFNCRFGDPETQVLMRRLQSDLLDLLEATVRRRLRDARPEWDAREAVCVIQASGGYPGDYVKGREITGIAEAETLPEIKVFHAGTKRDAGSHLVTSGGRVLGVTALGASLAEARARAYAGVEKIRFENGFCRTDIGLLSRP
ncbi:MAG TPA: phosphoribosylamine--glycine ligase, partial [Chthoniobacterales bacterium]